MMPTILLAGFEPFGGEAMNPSQEAIDRLVALGATPSSLSVAGFAVRTVDLPVTFAGAFPTLAAAVRDHDPALILVIGQAGGRAEINLERVALNLADATRPDNDGLTPVDEPVVADGPTAYFSPLPLKAIHAELARAGIPAKISDSAGTFVCNQVFYRACHGLAGIPVGLVHVPYAPAQTVSKPGTPSMAIKTVAEAIRIIAATAAETTISLKVAPGQPAR